MRVLVTWGSKLGGTEGIARTIAEELRRHAIEVVLERAEGPRDLRGFDAVIVGGALYANRWHREARHFITANRDELKQRPVWLFSSGPLDDSADHQTIPPAREVGVLMERVGALGHATFGGALPADAKGFPAEAMAKTRAGDWRNPEVIRAWTATIAGALPDARPGRSSEPVGGSLWRLAAYGVAGWALCAVVMGALLAVAPVWLAIAVHAVAAPLVFIGLSVRYFGAPGARAPLATALAFTVVTALLDAVIVAALVLRSFDMFASIAGTWLPFALIFVATWATGAIALMMPAPGAPKRVRQKTA